MSRSIANRCKLVHHRVIGETDKANPEMQILSVSQKFGIGEFKR